MSESQIPKREIFSRNSSNSWFQILHPDVHRGKIQSFALCTLHFALCTSLMLFALTGEARAGDLYYGDADLDADVNVTDILTIRQNAGGHPGVPLLGNTDASGHDCRLALSDALAISQYMVGFRSDLPIFTPDSTCWAIGLTITDGDGQEGTPNQTLTRPLETTLENLPACTQTISGCTLGGVTITYEITGDSTGGATLSGSVTTLDIDTSSSGKVSPNLTLGPSVGAVTIVASVSLLSATGVPLTTISAIFTETAITAVVNIASPAAGVCLNTSRTDVTVTTNAADGSTVSLTVNGSTATVNGGSPLPLILTSGGQATINNVDLPEGPVTLIATISGVDSDPVGITVDITIPNGTIVINSGSACTSSADVTLSLSYDGDVTQMRISTDGALDSEIWQAVAPSPGVTLPSPDGLKTVFVQFQDGCGNISTPISDDITLDTQSPTGLSATPAGGSYCATTVSLSMSDGTIYYTTDGSGPTTGSPVYGAPIDISISTTLKFMAVDACGNQAATVTEVYSIDTAAPTGLAADPAGGSYCATTVNLSASDGTIYYTLDGSEPATGGSAGDIYNDDFESGDLIVGGWMSAGMVSVENMTNDLDPASLWNAYFVQTGEIWKSIDTTGYENIQVSYQFATHGLDAGENFIFEISTDWGGAWTEVEAFGAGMGEPGWLQRNFDLSALYPSLGVENNPGFTIRFRQDADSFLDASDLDNVAVSAFSIGSPVYTGPINIDMDKTLKFMAVDSCGNQSGIVNEGYIIDTAAPTGLTAAPAGSSYCTTTVVPVSLSASDGTIYYTTDGTDPIPTGPVVEAFSDNFESGGLIAGGWVSAGMVSVETRTNDLDPSSLWNAYFIQTGEIWKSVDTTGYGNIQVGYQFATHGLESGENFIFEFSTDGGGAWTEVETFGAGAGESGWLPRDFDLSALSLGVEDNPAFAIRFRQNADSFLDASDLDNVMVSASSLGSPAYSGTIDISMGTTLKFTAVDACGNQSAIVTETYDIDQVVPTASIISPAEGVCLNSTTVVVSGTAEDGTGSGIAAVLVNGETASGTDSWSITLTSNQYGAPNEVGFRITSGWGRGVYVTGGYAYVADWGSGLAIIDVTDPANPATPVYRDTSGNSYGIYVTGGYAYLADYGSGLAIIDVTDPANPGTPVYRDTSGWSMGVYVTGGYAYLADWDSGLAIIDVSDPANPGTPVYRNTTGSSYGVYVTGGYAYVADGSSGLAIIDVSDPANPGPPVYQDTSDISYGIYVAGGYAYLAARQSGLAIIDVTDPANPATPVYRDTSGWSYGVYVNGGYAYVADEDYGLRVIDVSGFNYPVFNAVAMDNCGNVSDPAAVNVTIDTTANVSITSPGNGVTISAGDVFVGGTADTDITTVTVTSDQGHSESSGVDGAGNWAVVLTGVNQPSLTINAKGTDNCGNTGSDSSSATVIPPACSISSATPTTGCPGVLVTIAGTSFGAISGSVSFDSVTTTITFWSDTSIVVNAPGGDYMIVQVTTSSGGQCSLAGNYSYDNVPPDPPTITSPTDGSIFAITTIDTDITCAEGSCSQRLDGGAWTYTCATTFYGVTNGPHLLEAKCTDSCSNDSVIATSTFWVDTQGPWVIFTTPNSSQSGVPTGVNIEIQFNEDMDKGSVESGFSLSSGTAAPLSGDFYWSTGDMVTFVTPDLLTDYTTYTVDLTGAADLAGHSLTGTGVFPFNFTTGDCTPPQVVSKNPDGTTLVDSFTLTQITVTFNELMDTTQGYMQIRDTFDQTVVDAGVGGGSFGGTLTWSDSYTLTLDLDSPSPIQEGAGYRIEVQNLNDQSYNWIWGEVRWSIVTQGPLSDTDPPQLIFSLPFDGQDGVPRKLYDFTQNAIMLGFNEVLDPLTITQVNITLTNSSGPVTSNISWDVGDGPSPFSIILIPDLPLNPLETYTIGISGNIKDSAGNSFIPQSISFTTADEPDDTTPPLIEATVPGDGWIDLDWYGIDGDVGFNEPIDYSTVDISAITLNETNTGIPLKGLRFEGPDDDDPTTWDLRFYSTRAFPGMKPNTQYTLTISSGSISDINGNSLADYSWVFTTVPDGPGTGIQPDNRVPRIWRVWPDLNATSFENGNITIDLEIEAQDNDGDSLTVWAEDAYANSWTLTAPTGSGRYEYQTPVPGDFNSGNEPLITYDGWQTFTYYVDDGYGHIISVSNQVYIWPTADLPNQVSPLNGQVITAGGPTTLVWQNVDTVNAVFLIGQYMNMGTGEPGMCFEFPESTQTTLTGLSPGNYVWMVNQMAEIHGESFDRGGTGVGYQGMGVSNFTVADPGLGSISGTITYGGAAGGAVFVEAFTNPTFTGDPVSLTVMPVPGGYTIYNLPDGDYYVQSFKDTDGDMNPTFDEPWRSYISNPVTITGGTNKQGINITLTDPG